MTMNQSAVARAGADLFDFAVEREDVVWLMQQLPADAQASRHTLEHELQILKIIGVGWYIAYYLENRPCKTPLLQHYWQAVQEFSQNLSDTTGWLISNKFDYFQILKDRLDTYRAAMADQTGEDPLKIIGPTFAAVCDQPDNVFAMMTGAKLFLSVMTNVRTYLEAADLEKTIR